MFSKLHDTHFHLDLFNDDFKLVADRIENEKIFTIAVTNLPPLYTTLKNKLENNYKYIRPALGFHPELIGQYYQLVPKMWELLPESRYIGEVGLDYKTNADSKKKQVSFFENLIDKCNSYGGKVLTVHSRRSATDIISIIGSRFNGVFILHWYSGNLKTLKKCIDSGAYFSINYSMVKTDSGKKIISQIPLNRILLESDGPFIKLNKQPFVPNYNIHIVKKLSQILNLNYEELTLILYENFKSIITTK